MYCSIIVIYVFHVFFSVENIIYDITIYSTFKQWLRFQNHVVTTFDSFSIAEFNKLL